MALLMMELQALPCLIWVSEFFFLGAGIFSIVSISLWSAIFLFQLPLSIQSISSSQWHAHEMIYT